MRRGAQATNGRVRVRSLVLLLQCVRASSLARSTGWLLAGQGSSLLLQAAYFIMLARLLGVSEYGVFVGAFAFTSIAAQYSSLGSGMVLLRYVSGDQRTFAFFWANVLITTTSVGLIMTFLLHMIASHLLNHTSASLVALAAIANCICAQLIAETGKACRAFEKMQITAGLNLLTSLMRAIAAAGMLLILHHADARQWAVASTIVSAAGTVLAVIVATMNFGWPQFRSEILCRHAVEGVGYAFAQSTTGIYNDVDKTMLCAFGLNQANGIYTVAYRIIDIATIPISSLHDAALPKLFQLGRGGIHESRLMARRLLQKAVPFASLTAAILFLIAPALPRFVGPAFSESCLALRWLCLIPLFRSIHNITGAAITAAGLQRFRTGSQLIATVLNVGLNLWAIPNYGWMGAAWSSLTTDGSLALLNSALLLNLEQKGCAHGAVTQKSTLHA